MERTYKVAYVTGSRADYGIVRHYLQRLNADGSIDFSVLVTGSHLEEQFGESVKNIEADGFHIAFRAKLNIKNSNNAEILRCMASALEQFGAYFERNQYDLIILLGDRYEMMAAAIAAAMQKIPILHLHGGEVTYGNYDEFIRHSISKMSLYHFTSTETYRKRVIQLGESPDRVFYLGALGAENCQNIDVAKVDRAVLELPSGNYLVIAFHPETLTNVSVDHQVAEVLGALEKTSGNLKLVFMGTNADTKSGSIRSAWHKFVDGHENAYYFENLNVDSFLYLVKNSVALVGNSSSGIIEAPSLGVYTVNIGDRQRGREHGNSVIDVKCDRQEISKAIEEIRLGLRRGVEFENPYYVRDTAETYYRRTLEILQHERTTVKEFYDL